jgi:hypothetical protein
MWRNAPKHWFIASSVAETNSSMNKSFKMTLIRSIGTAIFLLACIGVNAQEILHTGHSHDHHSHEIALSPTSVYLIGEREVVFGLHAHYVYNLPHTNFGLGIGYESIFDDHKHKLLGVIGSYRPFEHLNINVSPGIKYEKFDFLAVNFAIHVEAAYEFEFGNFHLGPVAGVAISQGDYHLGIGVHLGIGY